MAKQIELNPEEVLDVIRLKSIHSGKGSIDEVLPFVTTFLININPQPISHQIFHNHDKRYNTNVGLGVYAFGDFRYNPEVGLFICYKEGYDGLGMIRRLEIGAFEKPLNEALDGILSRDLHDTTFDHVVLKDPISRESVHDDGRTCRAIDKVFSDALLSKYKS